MRRAKAIIISAACILTLLIVFFSTHFFIDGRIFSIFSHSAILTDADSDDISKLRRFISLRELDVSGCRLDNQTIEDLLTVFPDCDINYTVMLGNSEINSSAEHISLDDESAADCSLLLMLPNLKYADISACTEITDEIIAAAADDACNFIWQMELCGIPATSNETELVLDSPSLNDLKKLMLFRDLESVTVSNCSDYDTLIELAATKPDCNFVWSVDLCGVDVLSTDTRAVIADHKIEDLASFSKKLAYLPNLEYLDMCRCGLSNEEMETLTEQYPDIKFVWEITFGRAPVFWTVRTDIVCFSSLGMTRCNDEQLAPLLKYCTDLAALDLGHHNITDLTPFARLKKLKVLILGDNLIRDLSPLAELKELQYIELFSCKFTDVSALAQLPNLTEVCIGNNAIKDITPFLSMKQLNSLWIPQCGLDRDEQQALSEALPDCTIRFKVKSNPLEGWRVSELNMAIRKAFGNWRYVVEFNGWNDVTYLEGAPLKEVEPIELG